MVASYTEINICLPSGYQEMYTFVDVHVFTFGLLVHMNLLIS